MIKVAARGYESGQVTIDERFVEYANGLVLAYKNDYSTVNAKNNVKITKNIKN